VGFGRLRQQASIFFNTKVYIPHTGNMTFLPPHLPSLCLHLQTESSVDSRSKMQRSNLNDGLHALAARLSNIKRQSMVEAHHRLEQTNCFVYHLLECSFPSSATIGLCTSLASEPSVGQTWSDMPQTVVRQFQCNKSQSGHILMMRWALYKLVTLVVWLFECCPQLTAFYQTYHKQSLFSLTQESHQTTSPISLSRTISGVKATHCPWRALVHKVPAQRQKAATRLSA
jgi:hypothetical protein